MSINVELNTLGFESVTASKEIRSFSEDKKNKILDEIISSLEKNKKEILDANNLDIQESEKKLSKAMIDRLLLNDERYEGIINSIKNVIALNDPVGNVLFSNQRPNGMIVERVSVPLGVIGIIYESRPNVTVDATVLCLKAGNSVILRGGSECFNTNTALVKYMQDSLSKSGVNKNIVQYINTTDRAAVDHMLSGMVDFIDVVVPRGGKGLVKKVQDTAKIPVIGHLDGICHLYVDETSDPDKASEIVTNAKLRRTGICGAAETLLIDEKCLNTHLPKIIDSLLSGGCEIRGDKACVKLSDRILPATEIDWGTEYLDAIISIKTVKNMDEAIDHIAKYGSGHTESIISENHSKVEKFLNSVNSAIVMHNASTQFADGGEFGLGAEIGIATGKLHARGPVGLEGLTTYKYIVRGSGQVRP
jgi:glutamate-5-semialdehyde dehydrogenase